MWVLLIVGILLLISGGVAVVMGEKKIIERIAQAIAYAEGWGVQNSRPHRNHNPGNITRDITGKSIGVDGIYRVYATDADGWEALEKQVSLMFGGSKIYQPSMTIAEMANKYTTTQQADWARNVAAQLGVSTATKLSEIT